MKRKTSPEKPKTAAAAKNLKKEEEFEIVDYPSDYGVDINEGLRFCGGYRPGRNTSIGGTNRPSQAL